MAIGTFGCGEDKSKKDGQVETKKDGQAETKKNDSSGIGQNLFSSYCTAIPKKDISDEIWGTAKKGTEYLLTRFSMTLDWGYKLLTAEGEIKVSEVDIESSCDLDDSKIKLVIVVIEDLTLYHDKELTSEAYSIASGGILDNYGYADDQDENGNWFKYVELPNEEGEFVRYYTDHFVVADLVKQL